MQNFMKTIISAVKTWTNRKIKDSTADWNQNDTTADSYVKNRTHWEEEGVIIAEYVVSDFSLMEEPLYAVINPFEMNPVVGNTYTIVWDGISYNVKMLDLDGLGCIGNINYVDMESGGNIPFAIIFAGDIFLVTESTAASHTISISGPIIHKLDSKYLDLPTNLATTDDVEEVMNATNNKMNKSNPVGTGSFSMNRKSGTTVGNYSHTEGNDNVASGECSHAEGYNTTASGYVSHAEGCKSTASGTYSHAEGYNTTASSYSCHAEGYQTTASNQAAHAEGYLTTAKLYAHAEGYRTTASGETSHAEGYWTTASGKYSHVQGKHNISDTENKYAHIVGNGTSSVYSSNAHTLDWNGVGWFQGGLQVGGNAQDDGAKNVMLEGNAYDYFILNDVSTGTPYKIQIIDGNLVSSAMTTETESTT